MLLLSFLGASGLGFSLTSRDQHQRKPNCPVFIKNILPGGAALVDGNLKPGDRLLTVRLNYFKCPSNGHRHLACALNICICQTERVESTSGRSL